MTGKQALIMLEQTRYRTLRILKLLPNQSFEFYPVYMEMATFGKPSAIMAHIANAKIMYIQDYIICKGKTKNTKHKFDCSKKDEIPSELAKIRDVTNNWLLERLDQEFDGMTFNKRVDISWVFYHLREHEAHHIGHIAMMATMQGREIPDV